MELLNKHDKKVYYAWSEFALSRIKLRFRPKKNHSFVFEEKAYETLADVYKDWEDYEPKEPTLKDEKKRKLLMDWAKLNGIKAVTICDTFGAWGFKISANEAIQGEYTMADILFVGEKPKELVLGKTYAVEELCGEENEQ